jgi:hypothetical protein
MGGFANCISALAAVISGGAVVSNQKDQTATSMKERKRNVRSSFRVSL